MARLFMSSAPQWPVDREGYVCHWMVAGPVVSDIESVVPSGDQFDVEERLREAVADRARESTAPEAGDGRTSRLGMPWRFMGGRDGAFVNLSDFYPRLCRVRFDAATGLVANRAMTIDVALWSYAAADVWLNGVRVGGIDAPRYKPIRRVLLSLPLREGLNTLYLACETLGARDTRSVVGIQLLTDRDAVRVTLPDAAFAAAVGPALDFLEQTELREDCLRFPSPAPAGCRAAWTGGFEPNFAKAKLPVRWLDVSGLTSLPLKDGEPWITLEVSTEFGVLSRQFERTEQVVPKRLLPAPGFDENLRRILQCVAAVESLNRDSQFGFPIANILARKALGESGQRDETLLMDMLSLIEQRVDCADFLVCGLIRYLRNYPVGEALEARIREVLLGWRYWMDMDGADGMCFWSENHALMFYSCAMFAGELYPREWFPRARMTGEALHDWGRARVLEWLEDVERRGFEEFLSGIYMCLTFVALLNLIDYAEDGIARRAAALTDRLLEGLALHTFKGGFVAPMGRTYRGALYPFAQGVMSLINLIDPAQPYDFGEGWLGFFATTRYQIPDGLKALIERPASVSYATGNARIVLEKHEDWCLTSVQIPREPFERWPANVPGANVHAGVKARNEAFHGTTDFRPGGFGYQQHLWYAALDGEAMLFANHPGAASEADDMRPGYWHGNGVFPALRQQGNLLGLIYRIPEACPLHYIHLYAPRCRFDQLVQDGSWLFAQKGQGYVGFWASLPMEPWTGVNAHCEWRVYGDAIAGLCVCGGQEFPSLEDFMEYCRGLRPVYDNGRLRAEGFAAMTSA